MRPDDTGHVAFEELFRDKRRAIYNFFVAKGFSREESRELTQDTFLQAFKDRERFRGEASLGTWLHAVAKNLWKGRLRDGNRLKRSATVLAIEDLERERGRVLENGWRARTMPDAVVERVLEAERLRFVRSEIDKLPPRMGQCLRLSLRKSLEYKQIAQLLGVAVGTVKSNIADARARLQARCIEHFGP